MCTFTSKWEGIDGRHFHIFAFSVDDEWNDWILGFILFFTDWKISQAPLSRPGKSVSYT